MEKDFETGYHYYGARYYDSEKINWLSVDPLSDKYPSMSPYAYCANNPVILVDPDGRDWYEHKNKDGSKAVFWSKKTNPTLRLFGHIYNNVGDRYTLKEGNYTYEYHQNNIVKIIDESSNTKISLDAMGTDLSNLSLVIGVLESSLSKNTATFRLTNSRNEFDFKFYKNGWKGNQWVKTSSVSSLGEILNKGGKFLSYIGIGISAGQTITASTIEDICEYGLDTFMGAMGFLPMVGPYISLYWSFGGKQLHYKWVENVVMPQFEMGILGLPSTMPFK